MLAFGQPVRTELGPERAVVHRHDLRGARVPLGAQRGEAVVRDALDAHAVEDADRERADDCVGLDDLA
jgi:hypothetical protein